MTPPLYKYVTDAGLDILINQRIKATPPNQFNDAFEFQPLFEGQPSRRMVKRHLRNKDALRAEYDRDKAIGRTRESFKAYKVRMRDIHRQIVPEVASKVSHQFDASRHTMIDRLSKIVGVICFSSVPDSLLMWAHYAHSHTGLVIGFDVLHPVFVETPRIAAVTYSHMRPIISLGGTPISHEAAGWKALITKSTEWEYESEWRTTTLLRNTAHVERNGRIEFFASMPAKAIKSVILGARASEELHKKILDLVSTPDFKHVSVAKAQLHKTEYRLHILGIKPTPQ